jgi:hypothetical protein
MNKLFKIIVLLILFLILCVSSGICTDNNRPVNEKYLGMKPPGEIPVVFAPGIVSTKADETSFFISPDGNEIYFTRNHTKLMVIKKEKVNNSWGKPLEVSFAGKYYQIGEADISKNGSKIYFNCRRQVPGARVALTLWVSERESGGWGPARGMKPPVNNQVMHAVSIAPDGSIYASGLRKSKWVNDNWEAPVRLNTKGNHPFVANDGSYLLFSARQPQGYAGDLYIMFKNSIGSWSEKRDLGDSINTPKVETNPFVTMDGKYLFFSRSGDIYWVKTAFFSNLKKN